MFLEKISHPEDIKGLNLNELKALAEEIREFLIKKVLETGGHLSSNLGVIEVTLALHYAFNLEKDRIFFDVSHQCYTHKLLTGRRDGFSNLRQWNGLSGFTDPCESPFDVVKSGHAGSSISVALGLQTAFEAKDSKQRSIAFIGDASISNGLAFEALNHLGHLKNKTLIILNDNQMSISKTIGAVSRHLSRFISSKIYNNTKRDIEEMLEHIPMVGNSFGVFFKSMRKIVKKNLFPNLFEDLGVNYIGPVNGYNIGEMIKIFKNINELEGPVLIHVLTQKGKGFCKAEEDPTYYHGISGKNKSGGESFTSVFGKKMVELAEKNPELCVITAAMTDGTGLHEYARKYPDRYYDVGIAEEHAVAFASGLCLGGKKPVIAIYSTFMQRALDQMFHEISLQKTLAPVFVLDRSGLVGEDGPTHHGVFDIAYTRFLPGFILMSPKDARELEAMLEWSLKQKKPVVIRFPKGGFETYDSSPCIELGKSEVLLEEKDAELTFFTYGSLAGEVLKIKKLSSLKFNVVNLRFAKPLDEAAILSFASKTRKIVTLEEHSLIGGVGEAISSLLMEKGTGARVLKIGLRDQFYPHGARAKLLEEAGLTAEKILQSVSNFFKI